MKSIYHRETDGDKAEAVIGCTLMLVCIPVGIVIRGLVLVMLWRWFMVPIFGAPALSVPAAIGLMIVVGLFTEHASGSGKTPKDLSDAVSTVLAKVFISPFITLGVGWIVALFM